MDLSLILQLLDSLIWLYLLASKPEGSSRLPSLPWEYRCVLRSAALLGLLLEQRVTFTHQPIRDY